MWNPDKIYDRTNKDFKRKDLEEINCVLVSKRPGEQFYADKKELKRNPGQTYIITEKRKIKN